MDRVVCQTRFVCRTGSSDGRGRLYGRGRLSDGIDHRTGVVCWTGSSVGRGSSVRRGVLGGRPSYRGHVCWTWWSVCRNVHQTAWSVNEPAACVPAGAVGGSGECGGPGVPSAGSPADRPTLRHWSMPAGLVSPLIKPTADRRYIPHGRGVSRSQGVDRGQQRQARRGRLPPVTVLIPTSWTLTEGATRERIHR